MTKPADLRQLAARRTVERRQLVADALRTERRKAERRAHMRRLCDNARCNDWEARFHAARAAHA